MKSRFVNLKTGITALALLILLLSGSSNATVRADAPNDPGAVLSSVARDLGFPAPTKQEPKIAPPPSQFKVTIQINSEEKNLPQWSKGNDFTYSMGVVDWPKGTWTLQYISSATAPAPTAGGNYGHCWANLGVVINDSRASENLKAQRDAIQNAASGSADPDGATAVAFHGTKVFELTQSERDFLIKRLFWVQGDWLFIVVKELHFDVANGCSFGYDNGPDAMAIAEKVYETSKGLMTQATPSAQPTQTLAPLPLAVKVHGPKGPDDPDGPYLRVAADGVSVLGLTAELPQGKTAKEADFKIRADKGSPLSAASDRLGTFKLEKIEGNRVRGNYTPPEGFETQQLTDLLRKGEANSGIRIPVEVTVTDSTGQKFSGEASFTLVQPPVVLVHGVWSNPGAWERTETALKTLGFRYVARWGYDKESNKDNPGNNGDPGEIANRLSSYLNSDRGPIKQALQDRTLATRYDLVGHSLGGLIIRRVIANGSYQQVRKVVTVGTPHQGSEFADSFVYFSRNHLDLGPLKLPTPTSELGRVSQALSSAPPEAISQNEKWQQGHTEWQHEFFDWLVSRVRWASGLDPSFFVDGPAVTALQPKSQFLSALNAGDAHAADVNYYFIYGDKPVLSKESAQSARNDIGMLGGAEGKMSSSFFLMTGADWEKFGKFTEDNQVVVDTLLHYFSLDDTDGVVSTRSASGEGLGIASSGRALISADHVSLPRDSMPWIFWYLVGRKGSVDSGQVVSDWWATNVARSMKANRLTWAKLRSPAHLHAYDEAGRHVGLDDKGNIEANIPDAVFTGPEETTGMPEAILIMSDANIRFEVRGYQEGAFGLTVRRNDGQSDREVSYNNVPIRPGQSASLPLETGRYGDLVGPTGKVSPAEVRERAADDGWGGAALTLGIVVLGVAVLGGTALQVSKRRRRPRLATVQVGAGAQSATLPVTDAASIEAPQESTLKPMESAAMLAPELPLASPSPGAALCPKCGNPVAEDARFCAGCGQPVAQGPGYCVQCGKQLTEGATFCDSCGARSAAAAALMPSPVLASGAPGPVAPTIANRQETPVKVEKDRVKQSGMLFFLGVVCVSLTPFQPAMFLVDAGLVTWLWARGARKRAVLLVLLVAVAAVVVVALDSIR